jgi:BirA family biotin operon repressor/biotin-[acetyl-CoA-carboxylase] ligase
MPLRQPGVPPHDARPEDMNGQAPVSQAEPTHWGGEALWLQLEPLLPGLSVEVLPQVASTNTLLLDRARAGDVQPCLLVAEEQTGGRGRLGREWRSQAGASLTFSLALPLAPADWSGLSLAVGLALAEALDPPASDSGPAAASAPRIGLKWPNDLWLLDDPAVAGAGRKLGGILIETVSAGAAIGVGAARGAPRLAVVGVGLNLLPQPAEGLSQGYACLQELGVPAAAPRVLARVAEPLLRALLRFQAEGFAPRVAAYARRDVLLGRRVSTTQDGLPEGRADGVDAQGALRVRHDGLHRVLSGEVSVRTLRASPAVPQGVSRANTQAGR